MARGRELYKTCVPCHGADGRGRLALRTPAIAGLPDWYVKTELTKFMTDVRGAHPDDMEGHRMRPMARTLYHPGDVEAVTAFVSKLPPVPVPPVLGGDRDSGQVKYMSVCIACHGPDGRGNQALGAPPLVGQADWYLVAQMEKFKSGMRGAHPQDTQGSLMRAMSSQLRDTTDMRNVAAFIASMPK
jgi:cytochrome c553